MIAEIPLTLVLNDRMVGGPAYDGVEDNTLIAERAVRVVANGVAEEVAVASRVREIVLTVVFVHPRCLEETMGVTSLHRLAILVENDYSTRSLSKLLDVVAHAYYATVDSRAVGGSEELTLVVGSSTKIDEPVLVTILTEDRC